MSGGKFYCLLDNSSQIPRSMVSGHVKVFADRGQKTTGIQIAFSGSVSCAFIIHRNRKAIRREASEKVFEQRVILLNGGGRALSLQPGWHKYPFTFRLPPGIPSSFLTSVGAVEYALTAIMTGPFKTKIHKLKVSIKDFLDLDIHPKTRNPIAFQMQKNFLISGPVDLLFSVSKSGFIPGEEFTVALDIHNYSSTTLNRCKIFLIQVVSYEAEGEVMTNENEFFLAQMMHAVQKEENFKSSFSMKVPSVSATDLSSQRPRIIRMEYFFELKLKFGIGTLDIAKRVPIIIGTVPIVHRTASPNTQRSPRREVPRLDVTDSLGRTTESHLSLPELNPSQLADEGQNQDNVSLSSEITLPPAYEDFPPPSYAEASRLEFGEQD